MGISPERLPPLRPHCSRSEVALNGPAAATDRILLGPVLHLRHVSARRRDRERHLTAVEMDRPLVHSDQRPVPYQDCSNNSSLRSWANQAISESQMS